MGLQGLSIYYVIRDRVGRVFQIYTNITEGGLPNLLQYYNITQGGLFKVYYNITYLVGIWKGFDHFQYYICFYAVLRIGILSQIWKIFANMRFQGSTLRLFQYYVGGIFSIYYIITIGAEGSTGTPNLYHVINGRLLTV